MNPTLTILTKIDTRGAEIGIEKIKGNFMKMGNTLGKVASTLAVGMITIFSMGVLLASRYMKTILKENDELNAKMEYANNILKNMVAPIVELIVNLVYKLAQYLGYVFKLLTGKDVFAKASGSLKSGAKSAKEIKQQLSGVDELNIIGSKSSGGGGVSDSGINTKDMTFDTTNAKNFVGILGGIVGALTAVKLGFIELGKTGGFLKFLGLAETIWGIIGAVTTFIEYLNDPSWSNFGQTIEYIGLTLAGIGLLFTSLPIAIAGAIVLILGILAEFWQDIKVWLDNLKEGIYKTGDDIMNWINEKIGGLGYLINVVVGTITGLFSGLVEGITHLFDGIFTGAKDMVDGVIKIFKGDLYNGSLQVVQGIRKISAGFFNALIGALNAIVSPIRALIVAIGKVTGKNWTMENIRIPYVKLAKGGIVNLPGRGVPVGGAVAGERGMEGVIPLTDASQMELLGQSIGKYINVQATIPIYVGNRQIAREIRQINEQDSFASNGG